MTISSQQQLDLLWKKIGYGVAKSDTSTVKDATNESILSSPFIAESNIWSQASLLPKVPPSLSTLLVNVYNSSTAIKCIMDITVTANRTWLTGLTDWIPIQFGSTYLVNVYLDVSTSTTPTTTGTQLYSAGSNNNDEWFFDYEAGLLNFIGINLPNLSFVGKSIFITGARYIGAKGLGTFGNLSVAGNTISSSGNITLAPVTGSTINASGAVITNVGYSTAPTAAATTQFVVDSISSLHSNIIYQGDSIVRLSDPTGGAGTFSITVDNQLISTVTNSSASFAGITMTGSTISSSSDIVIQPGLSSLVTVNTTSALKVPVGTTLQRPAIPTAGEVRFNSTTGQLEWFNSTSWINAQAQLLNQVFQGDGTTLSFTLIQATSVNNIFVMINGIVSTPVDAYDVLGTVITFIEPPKVGDSIDIRYLSEAVASVDIISNRVIVNPNNIAVGTTSTNIDSFDITLYIGVRYITIIKTSDGNVQSSDLTVIHNGINAVVNRVNDSSTGGGVILTYSVSIVSGQCILSVVCNTAGNNLKLQSIYSTQ